MSNLVETTIKNQSAGYGVTQKYTPITTQSLIDQLVSEGYVQKKFKATKVRKASKQGFQRHLTVLTHANFLRIGEDQPTVLIDNSYDGLSSLRIYGGLDVDACENGLIFGNVMDFYRLPHIGLDLRQVLECLSKISANLPNVAAQIERFKSIQLTEGQQKDFASQIATLALSNVSDVESVNLQSVLTPRRAADASASLWHVFNRGEESLIRGGIGYTKLVKDETDKTFTVKHNTTRRVESIDRRIKLERAAWDLMESLAG